MDIPAALRFLRALKKNNNRDWFDEHRDDYRAIRDDFEEFVDELLREASSVDPALSDVEPKQCIFRLFRDVRFSKIKLPYKTHLSAFMAPGGRKSGRPGYYVHIAPGNESLAAAGVWMPDAAALAKIRAAILRDGDSLVRITNTKAFRSRFPEGFDVEEGGSLKKAPKGVDPNHPHIALLRLKSFTVSTNLSDAEVQEEDLAERFVEIFEDMRPLNDWLAEAL